MSVIPLPRTWQPNDIIPAQWGNNVGLNDQTLDVRTGGDPGAAGRLLIANGATSGVWRLLQQGDFGAGIIPSTALIDRKVNTLNPNYPTFAAAVAGGSHFFDVGAAPDGPTPSSFMAMQIRHFNYGAGDYHITLAADLYNPRELYVQGVVNGSPGPWYRLFHSGNATGAGSGIDADKLQGKVPGHGTGQIPINDGAANPNLNAGIFNGQPPSYYAPLNVIVIWPNAITAPPVGWVHEANLAGKFPLGATPTYTLGSTGGQDGHHHTITHDHGPGDSTSVAKQSADNVTTGGNSRAVGQNHDHYIPALPAVTVNSSEFSGLPPYWSVYYIRRTS